MHHGQCTLGGMLFDVCLHSLIVVCLLSCEVGSLLLKVGSAIRKGAKVWYILSYSPARRSARVVRLKVSPSFSRALRLPQLNRFPKALFVSDIVDTIKLLDVRGFKSVTVVHRDALDTFQGNPDYVIVDGISSVSHEVSRVAFQDLSEQHLSPFAAMPPNPLIASLHVALALLLEHLKVRIAANRNSPWYSTEPMPVLWGCFLSNKKLFKSITQPRAGFLQLSFEARHVSKFALTDLSIDGSIRFTVPLPLCLVICCIKNSVRLRCGKLRPVPPIPQMAIPQYRPPNLATLH